MLTSKSMLFDNEYIENLIEGYTTLNVTGREMAEVEVDSLEVGRRDGAIFRSKKYRPRTLTIEFALEGDDLGFNPDNTVLIERLNQLNSILETEEEVPISFRDEDDKFYMGIRTGLPDVKMHLGIATGTFQIFCADPFKYSKEEYTAESIVEADGRQTFIIDYNGTHRAFPVYEAKFYTQNTAPTDINLDAPIDEDADDTGILDTTSVGNENESLDGKGACGYVAFFDEDEHILQFGNPDAEDKPVDMSKNLIDENWQTLGTWGSTAQALWLRNTAIVPDTYNQRGDVRVYKSYNNAQSTTVNNTVINTTGTGVTYKITATASNRSASGVALKFSINAKFTSACPKKSAIVGIISVRGVDHSVTIKSGSTGAWSKGKSVTVTLSFTESELESYTDVLSGVKFEARRSGGTGSVGRRARVSCNNINIPTYIEPVVNSYYLTLTPGAAVAVNNQFYGPTILRNIPADDTGNKGWADWFADFHVKFAMGTTANDKEQMGSIFVGLISGVPNGLGQLTNQKIEAGVTLYKTTSGSNGYIRTIYDGEYVDTDKQIDVSYYNTSFGTDRAAYTTYDTIKKTTKVWVPKKGKVKGHYTTKTTTTKKAIDHAATTSNNHILIEKVGTKVTYTVGGEVFTFEQASSETKVYQMVIGIFEYGGKPRMNWMGVFSAKFRPITDADGVVRTVLPFNTGDKLVADSSSGEIYLNDTLRPELGALGNDWENMYLAPGADPIQIGTAYSDWCNEEAMRRCNADDGFDESIQYYNSSGTAVSPTQEQFESNQPDYYIKESCAPKFTIRYREVFA